MFVWKPLRAWLLLLLVLAWPLEVQAALTSPNYRLDPDAASTFGGQMSSGSYKLVDSGGEAVIGSGSSPSYKLAQGYVAQLTQSIQLTILPNGIAAYYPFDTGTGIQAYDLSTNENRAVISNAPGWVSGKIGQALSLNGSSQYASAPHSANLNLTGNLTIGAWVNLTDYANANTIATKATGNGTSSNTFELRTEASTGKLQFVAYDTALRTITSDEAVPVGSWVHVAVAKGGGVARLYINGVDRGSGAVGSTSSNSDELRLGVRDDLSNYFKGILDEVKLFNRVLSAADIKNDYEAGISGLRNGFTLPSVSPGISQTYDMDAIVRTDAGGYDLFIQQDHDLRHTDGSTTIPAISGTIASPAAWSEGVTKGLGFAVIAGTGVESKWGTGPAFNYAAAPNASTNYHTRIGLSGGVAEKTTLQFRADTAASQKQGAYSNTIVYTATLKP
jgi:hypothetical protein